MAGTEIVIVTVDPEDTGGGGESRGDGGGGGGTSAEVLAGGGESRGAGRGPVGRAPQGPQIGIFVGSLVVLNSRVALNMLKLDGYEAFGSFPKVFYEFP